MKALSPMQRKLVDARLSGMNISDASRAAGYCDHSAGSRALALPHENAGAIIHH